MCKKTLKLSTAIFASLLTFISSQTNADLLELDEFKVGVVIGASLQNGKGTDIQGGRWYQGGVYKTWVDNIASMTDKKFHWLNYARGGAISSDGVTQIQNAIDETTWPDGKGGIKHNVDTVVITFWGNTFMWGPFNQTGVDIMVSDMQDQIALAKSYGIKHIIVTGMPRYKDIDLARFQQIFPVPDYIDEAGYNEVRHQYYQAFSAPNPDYVFVETWCNYETVDGVHANYRSARKAAGKVLRTLQSYDSSLNKKSHLTCTQ